MGDGSIPWPSPMESQFITNTATTTVEKHPGDTTHKIGNCGRNSLEMSQGAKTNGNSWATQQPLVISSKKLQLLGVSSQSHTAKHMTYKPSQLHWVNSTLVIILGLS